jgi:DNA-binding CsgD family transcriptional regulator
MTDPATKLSPRQRECLRMVWHRHTSKEIAAELGISSSTVDGYIKEAMEILGARDRRHAAAIAFGPGAEPAPDNSGDEFSRVSPEPSAPIAPVASTKTPFWPQPNLNRQPDTQSLGQVLRQIVIIAIGSMIALSLTVSLASGVAPLLRPVLNGFDRLVQ